MSLRTEVRDLMLMLMDQRQEIPVSKSLRGLVEEVVNVPERPADYKPVFKFKEPKIVVLVTGGLDSTYVYQCVKENYATNEIVAIYVDIGQPYAKKEIDALARLQIPYVLERQTELIWTTDKYWKHIIPARNLLLLAIAAEHLADTGGLIMFGAVNGEMPVIGGDKSQRFIRVVNQLLKNSPNTIHVTTPLKDLTKTDIVFKMQANNPGTVEKTVSCFSGGPGVHCGACQACLRKWIAFTNNDLELKTETPIYLGCAEYITKYRTLMTEALKRRDFSKYSERRCEQTIEALVKLEIS